MRCPKCDFAQPDDNIECLRCGVVFSKLKALPVQSIPTEPVRRPIIPDRKQTPKPLRESGTPAPTPEQRHEASEVRQPEPILDKAHRSIEKEAVEAEQPPEPRHLDRTDLLVMISGAGIAALAFISTFVSNTLWTMTTLVHEMGHALFGWLFGLPSLPAFDLMYGGGVTISQQQSILLLVVIYCLLGYLMYYYRKNTGTLIWLGVLGIIHFLCVITKWHEVIYLFMGHGTELIIAGLFIYRALSGSAVVHFAERPLYAAIGFFIVYQDTGFAYRLMTSPEARQAYGEAKGGGHWMDFSRIGSDYLGTSLENVAGVFFVFCLLTIVLGYLAFRYQEYIHTSLVRRLRKEPS